MAHLGSIGAQRCAWRQCCCCWSAISISDLSIKNVEEDIIRNLLLTPIIESSCFDALGRSRPPPSTGRDLSPVDIYDYDLFPTFVRGVYNFCTPRGALMEGQNKVWTVRCQSAFCADGVSSKSRSTLDSLLIMCIIYR